MRSWIVYNSYGNRVPFTRCAPGSLNFRTYQGYMKYKLYNQCRLDSLRNDFGVVFLGD